MRIIQITSLLSIIVILLLNNVFAEDDRNLLINDNFALKTSSDAVESAILYTGFDKSVNFDRKKTIGEVSLIVMHDTTTPFLSDSIDGKSVWKVEFKDIILKLDNTRYIKQNVNPMSFYIYLDAMTGRLFKIISFYSDATKPRPKEALASTAEKQLTGITHERYYSFPLKPPEMSLFEALNRDMYGSPLIAELTIAYYVTYSIASSGLVDSSMRSVWVVHMHGMLSMNGVTHMRNVIDVNTGKVIWSINLPSAIKDESYKHDVE